MRAVCMNNTRVEVVKKGFFKPPATVTRELTGLTVGKIYEIFPTTIPTQYGFVFRFIILDDEGNWRACAAEYFELEKP